MMTMMTNKEILTAIKDEIKAGSVMLNFEFYMTSIETGLKRISTITQLEYDKHIAECNTACCAAGLVPKICPEFVARFVDSITGEINFRELSKNLVKSPKQWDFLFGGRWKNDRKQAVLRFEFYLKYGRVPPNFHDFIYYENYTMSSS